MSTTTRKSVSQDVEKSLNQLKHSGQNLTEAVLPPNVYKTANTFVCSVEYRDRYSTDVFNLILKRSKGIELSKSVDKIKQWQPGLKALLRYPMDLFLAPNRPELKIIKVRIWNVISNRISVT